MTMLELDKGVELLINSIMKATKDYQNNPEKAEEYIRRKVAAIYQAGKEIGREYALNDIFNGPAE